MELLLIILLGMLFLGVLFPSPPPNNNDKPVKYWNNGR